MNNQVKGNNKGYALIILLLAVVIIIGVYLLSGTSIFEPHEQKKVLDENQRLIAKINRTIANGEDINAEQNAFKSTFLHIACKKGDVDSIRLLVNNGANLNCVDLVGNTPLHHAVIDNNLEIAQLLLDYSADVDFKDDSGQTALHMAALFGRLEFVKLLIQYGANVNITTETGTTPIELAKSVLASEWIIKKNQINVDQLRNVIKILRKYGATE